MRQLNEDENIMIYLGLISALIDHIELDLYKSKFRDSFLRYKLKDIQNELIKKEKLVFTRDNSHSDAVQKQYMDAGTIMLRFFLIGLQMSNLEEIRAQGFNTQLELLLHSYGISTDV
jgi:hypothetical protein